MVKEWGQLVVLQGYLEVKILSHLYTQPRVYLPSNITELPLRWEGFSSL